MKLNIQSLLDQPFFERALTIDYLPKPIKNIKQITAFIES